MSRTQDEVAKFLKDLDVLTSKKVSKKEPTVAKDVQNSSLNMASPPKVANILSQGSSQTSSRILQNSIISPEKKQTIAQAEASKVEIPLSQPPSLVLGSSSTPPAVPAVSKPVNPGMASILSAPVATVVPPVGLSSGPHIVPPVGPTMSSSSPPVGGPPMGPPPQTQLGVSKQKVKKATHGYVPLAAPVSVDLNSNQPQIQETQNSENTKSQEWNLTSLWNKASQVAENTARVVAGNENVMKMAEKVNANLSKLAETLAPKIEMKHEQGYLADQLTVWICLEAEQSVSRDVLKDYTYSMLNELWLNPGNRMCKSVKVNNVDPSEIEISSSLQEAVQKTEGIVTRIQKLSDEAMNRETAQSVDHQKLIRSSVIMVVQQICLPISSALLDDPTHTFFLVTLVSDNPEYGFISCSSCSQSIVQPIGFIKSGSVLGNWEASQKVRVLETVVGDILEEFIAKVGHCRQMQTNTY